MSTKPVFVPLKREWFEAFARGEKRIEWRAYGARWNCDAIAAGRAIVLSLGYSGARLHGLVVDVERVARADAPDAARQLFPNVEHFCAIHVALESDGMPRN
jgi:hypothetical protein